MKRMILSLALVLGITVAASAQYPIMPYGPYNPYGPIYPYPRTFIINIYQGSGYNQPYYGYQPGYVRLTSSKQRVAYSRWLKAQGLR